jgi:hypothetical protein
MLKVAVLGFTSKWQKKKEMKAHEALEYFMTLILEYL